MSLYKGFTVDETKYKNKRGKEIRDINKISYNDAYEALCDFCNELKLAKSMKILKSLKTGTI